jgi:hypothetical protein
LYSRREVHDIFDPDTPFTPQAGTWGIQGIVSLTRSPGDFAFFVTYGASQGSHEFDEPISEDGVLTWQSQPKQRLNSPQIQRLITHDDRINAIHLFLRTRPDVDYTYFGQLGYLDHDPGREAPVYFTWQLMDWPAPPPVLADLAINLAVPTEPVSPAAAKPNTLTKTPPPDVRIASGGRGPLRPHPTLPGQDAANQQLGFAGEQLALRYERGRLSDAGRGDLADKIVHIAVVEGDWAGYDIRSFNSDGTDRHLEVKTTSGPASNAFYITPNEIEFSVRHPDSYVLMRIYAYSDETDSANFYELPGPVDRSFALTPTEYRARLVYPN